MARKRTTTGKPAPIPGQPPQYHNTTTEPNSPELTPPTIHTTPTTDEPTAPAEGPAAGIEAARPYPVDLQDLGQQDPHYRFAHAYLYGPHALTSGKTYAFLYPDSTEDAANTSGSRMLNHGKVQAHIRALCSQRKISREFVEHELTREITRRVTRKTRQVVTQTGDIVTLSQTEERDRTPALTLAADILGMRKGPEVQGVTVHVHMGADLALDDAPPLDVTPASDSIE